MSGLIALAPKLDKLLPLLASDKDGEVVAAARAVGRTLAAAGLDFHDLAAAVAAPAVSSGRWPPTDEIRHRWADIPRNERTAWLTAMQRSGVLSPWEENFVDSILAQQLYRPWAELSLKQRTILDRLVRKMTEAA